MHAAMPGKQITVADLTHHMSLKPCRRCEAELVKGIAMDAQINSDFEQIDHRTCQSICDAVGERLQQSIRPETELSPRLRELMDELRRRDNDLH